jgi:hypothetical protein
VEEPLRLRSEEGVVGREWKVSYLSVMATTMQAGVKAMEVAGGKGGKTIN